jgi:hypothetical protein
MRPGATLPVPCGYSLPPHSLTHSLTLSHSLIMFLSSNLTLSFCPSCTQIGFEKHRMLSLFLEVPELVRVRLAKRCRDVFEHVRTAQTSPDGDDEDAADANQVPQLVSSAPLPAPCIATPLSVPPLPSHSTGRGRGQAH